MTQARGLMVLTTMASTAQGGGWASPGADAIAALVDLSADEVAELLGAGCGGAAGGGCGVPAFAQRAARTLAALEAALTDGGRPTQLIIPFNLVRF